MRYVIKSLFLCMPVLKNLWLLVTILYAYPTSLVSLHIILFMYTLDANGLSDSKY